MARSDEQIKRDIIDSLYWDDRVNANDVDAEVSNGIATLRGTVPSYPMAEARESLQGADLRTRGDGRGFVRAWSHPSATPL